MNEFVKNLANQHFVKIVYDNGSEHECYEFSRDGLENFVELIVKKCTTRLREIDWAYDIPETNQEANAPCMVAADDLEEYFGFEHKNASY